jgi:hypothetical protein
MKFLDLHETFIDNAKERKERELVYIMSPYSHPTLSVRRRRWEETVALTGYLQKNIPANFLSPIVHCHPIAEAVGLRGDAHYWQEYNQALLDVCTSAVAFEIIGHKESAGMLLGAGFARSQGIPVYTLDDSACNLILSKVKQDQKSAT